MGARYFPRGIRWRRHADILAGYVLTKGWWPEPKQGKKSRLGFQTAPDADPLRKSGHLEVGSLFHRSLDSCPKSLEFSGFSKKYYHSAADVSRNRKLACRLRSDDGISDTKMRHGTPHAWEDAIRNREDY